MTKKHIRRIDTDFDYFVEFVEKDPEAALAFYKHRGGAADVFRISFIEREYFKKRSLPKKT